MNLEQDLSRGSEAKETLINKEAEVVHVPSAEDLKAKDEIRAINKMADEKEIDKLKNELMGGVEYKEEFPEGHILNPNILDKIAKLEAIDWGTLEFSQERYDDYINEQKKLGPYSVDGNQKVINESMALGRSFKRSLGKTEPIYGKSGLNRYGIDYDTGNIKLLRGISNTSGSQEYKNKLAQKAKEFGIMVDGQ